MLIDLDLKCQDLTSWPITLNYLNTNSPDWYLHVFIQITFVLILTWILNKCVNKATQSSEAVFGTSDFTIFLSIWPNPTHQPALDHQHWTNQWWRRLAPHILKKALSALFRAPEHPWLANVSVIDTGQIECPPPLEERSILAPRTVRIRNGARLTLENAFHFKHYCVISTCNLRHADCLTWC